MVAEIVCVGTELLLGDIVNTNAQHISKELAHIGIDLYYQTVVGDNKERVWNVLDTALKRSDLIIMTGGLGPTKDDLTKEVAASFFGKKLVFHEQTYEHVRKKLESYGINDRKPEKTGISPRRFSCSYQSCRTCSGNHYGTGR